MQDLIKEQQEYLEATGLSIPEALSRLLGYKIESQMIKDLSRQLDMDEKETREVFEEGKDKHQEKINHPKHYNSHPSGIECIQITEHMGFNLGNALKYIWRADLKDDAVDDLRKAAWYLQREIAKRIK